MGLALSGGGDPFRPTSQRKGRTFTASTPGASDRTLISARPGTTLGALMMTRSGYGPAVPSNTTFCSPMWAWIETGKRMMKMAAKAEVNPTNQGIGAFIRIDGHLGDARRM